MMGLKATIKSIILKVTPDKPLQVLKRVHYVHSIKKISETVEQDFQVVKYLVNPMESVIDVGAAIGIYTVFLSKLVGANGKVYSIEPIPPTFDILSHNIEKLKMDNVKLFNLAVSEKDGSVTMEVPRYLTGGENYYQSRIIDATTESLPLRHFQVHCKSLDSLFATLETVFSFMKIDVEGHEFQAIIGAKRLISTSMPALLIEITRNPETEDSPGRKIFGLLREQGYSAYWFDGEKLNRTICGKDVTNYLFLTERHLHQLRRKAPLLTLGSDAST